MTAKKTAKGRKPAASSTGIKSHPFKNVAVLEDVHEKLREIANAEKRSMAQQLSVIIDREHRKMFAPVWVDEATDVSQEHYGDGEGIAQDIDTEEVAS